jgi:hypothetical protein
MRTRKTVCAFKISVCLQALCEVAMPTTTPIRGPPTVTGLLGLVSANAKLVRRKQK